MGLRDSALSERGVTGQGRARAVSDLSFGWYMRRRKAAGTVWSGTAAFTWFGVYGMGISGGFVRFLHWDGDGSGERLGMGWRGKLRFLSSIIISSYPGKRRLQYLVWSGPGL